VDFAAGVFTNLSPEHLDYHKDMPGYARAKGRLFGLLSPDAAAVFNVDDGNAARVVGGTRARLIGFGFGKGAQVRAVDCRTGPGGSRWRMVSPWGEVRLSTCLAGRHNVYNCLAAAAVTAALAVELPTVARGIAGVSSVRGRLESVDEGQDFAVFVDYAHTDDALENVLKAVRPMTMKRVIVVVGCGGDRDVSKRPRMRAVAGRLADHCVVTSDNPRSEDPMKIIEQMMHGATDASKFTIEPDRRAAITQAIGMARAGDVVLIAGKGHETSQIFGDRRVHFDDREVAGEVLRKAVSS
jgi:UDP-N-acetylmuramyl-tripeptide synthetase